MYNMVRRVFICSSSFYFAFFWIILAIERVAEKLFAPLSALFPHCLNIYFGIMYDTSEISISVIVRWLAIMFKHNAEYTAPSVSHS